MIGVITALVQVLLRFLPYLRPIVFLIRQLKNVLLRHPIITALLLTVLAVGLGALASFWKQKHLISYGVAEIAFGTLLAYNNLVNLAPNYEFPKLFAIGTAIYVIARGFNNGWDGRKLFVGRALRTRWPAYPSIPLATR